MKSWQKLPLFRFLSSLKLAVLSILLLAGVLAVATVYESWYGMRGAHILVYGQLWFYGVLSLLAINVTAAALSRWPWKRHQIGFVTTHSGILILLLGSWLTMRFGVDGNLPVVEGSEDRSVILHALRLEMRDPQEGTVQVFPIPESAVKKAGEILRIELGANDQLTVAEFLPRAQVRQVVEPSKHGIGTPAVRVELFNDRFGLDEWLFVQHPEKAAQVNLGPALLSFQKLWTQSDLTRFQAGAVTPQSDSSKGVVVVEHSGREFRVEINQSLRKWQPAGSSGFQVQVEKYLPYAIVKDNELVNAGDDPVNPSVLVRLRNPQGQEEKHTLFANFPEFATLHRSAKPADQPEWGVKLRMLASQSPAGAGSGVRGHLAFAQGPDDETLYYRVTGRDAKAATKGSVKVGEEVATGWMDLRFRILDWFTEAVAFERPDYVERVEGAQNYPAALELVRTRGDAPAQRWWLMEGQSAPIAMGNRVLEAHFNRERITLPFALALKKFHMGTDPGTDKAATYESTVVVRDPQSGAESAQTLISMNAPLDHGGYTFYQASYQLRDGAPPISVFSVNYDPGRWVKYLGSLVMVMGILLMFYFNPHYWNIVLGKQGKPR